MQPNALLRRSVAPVGYGGNDDIGIKRPDALHQLDLFFVFNALP
jgi:hypothetical protein